MRAWALGRPYPTRARKKRARPVIAAPSEGFLSFTNLVEAHALAAMRREYQLRLEKIRPALRYVENELGVDHPLACQEFKTDGVELFVERFGRLLNVSREGQLAIRDAFGARLSRVEYSNGRAVRLFPIVRTGPAPHPKLIVIDPERGFGRPVLKGTGVPVSVIQERFKGGDSSEVLADDFGVKVAAIEEALRAA